MSYEAWRGRSKVKKRIWISKYALSAGITEHEATITDGYAYPGHPFMSFTSFKIGKDAHETKEGAIQAADVMRKKKIASLTKQIADLEKMTFEVKK